MTPSEPTTGIESEACDDTSALTISLPLLLPDIPDERDRCVDRLRALISEQRGVPQSHLRGESGAMDLSILFDACAASKRGVDASPLNVTPVAKLGAVRRAAEDE